MRMLLLVLVACDSGQREPVPAPPVPVASDAKLAAIPIPDASLDAVALPRVNDELVAMQDQLGIAAFTCAGTAKLLANQGTATAAKLEERERRILKLCVKDRWPEDVRVCVAQATHDPLSCTSDLTTAKQKANWNVVFDSW